jgi:hypothetical protein
MFGPSRRTCATATHDAQRTLMAKALANRRALLDQRALIAAELRDIANCTSQTLLLSAKAQIRSSRVSVPAGA